MTTYTEQDILELETINDFLRFGFSWASQTDLYYGHGTDNAWDDIRQLILESLQLPFEVNAELLTGRLLKKEKQFLFSQLDKRINQRIPVPYLTHRAYFCDLPFYVDERVIIPRSPIAELIRNQFAPWVKAEKVSRVLDMCTGSGCIAIACCYAFPEAEVDAVDISKEALDVAAFNREQHDLAEQLTLIESDGFSAVPEKKYDIIVSNPPYVSEEEMQILPEEYLHEPNLALEAKNNGLAVIESLLKNASRYLSEDGVLIVEAGNSETAVNEAWPDLPFTWLEFEHGGYGVFVLSSEQLSEYFTRN